MIKTPPLLSEQGGVSTSGWWLGRLRWDRRVRDQHSPPGEGWFVEEWEVRG